LMEGISHEAAALAGHLRLNRLIVLWDDNGISIDGSTRLATSEDVRKRFEAYGWATLGVDGHDEDAIRAAIELALTQDRPVLVACRTVIGYGAPHKAGTAASHGAPLGEEEVREARERLGWPYPPFEIPQPILDAWRAVGRRCQEEHAEWLARLAELPDDRRRDFERRQHGELPEGWREALAALRRRLIAEPVKVATRKASQMALEVINEVVGETVGGSADLTGSNNTKTAGMEEIEADDFSGRYIHYGVREHAMAAAMNGIALHRGFIPYGGTFLVFADYSRPAIRVGALMGLRVVHVMTHDSIGLGEDGPTHQPVEHLASLRAMPNLRVFRPADAIETAECWELALSHASGPSLLALTRQGVPQVRCEESAENLCARGAYVLREASASPRVILYATGSEVAIADEVRCRLEEKGTPTRLVSVPCWELFDEQDEQYRATILDGDASDALKVALEAAAPMGWERFVGSHGLILGMRGFGASAPAADLYRHFGLDAEHVLEAIEARL
ncbi:MAG: transketolase, partial [Alphaproteobacteria bacterium]